MTNNDDLFDKESVKTKTYTINSDNYQEYYQRQRTSRNNYLLVVFYIVIQLIAAFVYSYISSSNYGYLEDAVKEVTLVEDLTFTVTDNLDSETNMLYPYELTYTGIIKNDYSKIIPVIQIDFVFYDQDNEAKGSRSLFIENLDASEQVVINETFLLEYAPASDNIVIYTTVPHSYRILFMSLQGLLTLVTFILIDKSYLLQSLKTFMKEPKKNAFQIIKGFAMLFIVIIAGGLVLRYIGVTDISNNEAVIRSMFIPEVWASVALFIGIVIAPPIVEELIFRKVLYGFVDRSFGYIAAIIISSLVFALLHIQGDYIQLIVYFPLGLVLGYVYHKSNHNIWVVIGVHMLNNFYNWLLVTIDVF